MKSWIPARSGRLLSRRKAEQKQNKAVLVVEDDEIRSSEEGRERKKVEPSESEECVCGGGREQYL
jgi:hypothetical protein